MTAGPITIASTSIRRDIDGRYSLNDLHRAAGGEKRHGPSYWLAAQQTGELVSALSDTGIPVSVQRGGTDQGTFVVRELVYAYAMWISPAFHLQVIRAYDQVQSRQAVDARALSDPATLRALLIEFTGRTIALENQVAEQAPKLQALERIADARGSVCVTDAAKTLQMRPGDLFAWLQREHWIYRRAGTNWLPYQERIDQGLMVSKVITRGDGGETRIFGQALITPKGLTKISEQFQRAAVGVR